MRPADAGGLTAAPVASVAPDGVEHVTHRPSAVGSSSPEDLVHLRDVGPGGAHGSRRGAARVSRFEVVGDIGRYCRERLAPVIGGPALPARPRRSVGSASVRRERGNGCVNAALLINAGGGLDDGVHGGPLPRKRRGSVGGEPLTRSLSVSLPVSLDERLRTLSSQHGVAAGATARDAIEAGLTRRHGAIVASYAWRKPCGN